MILGQLFMKRHKVIINMINDSLAFWPDYCIYNGATFCTKLSLPSLLLEKVAVKIEKDITSQKIIKSDTKKDMTDFL